MSDNHGVPLLTPDASAPLADRLVAALRTGSRGDAEALLAVQSPPDVEALCRTGDLLMRRRRWSDAGWVLGQIPDRDAATEMKRRLSINLASLERHRPEVYEALVALPAQHEYTVAATASGKPTLLHRRPDGTAVSLSPGVDPLAAAAGAKQQIEAATRSGETVGLCGIGDGYLAQVLAHNPPALFMDKEQPVFVIEPEPQIVLQCLMIHDYSGSRGPIEQRRFYWFVGEGWDEQLERLLFADLFLASPSLMVGQGASAPTIQTSLKTIAQKLGGFDVDLAQTIEETYAARPAADFAATFAAVTSTRPRVLLLTTRFSTVLQFSTRDTAAAFERLGWDARVIIEPSPHHRVLRTAIRAALAEFKPDLVFQIDHLRHEHDGLFPANVPFACWIQDHLPHLATTDAGRRVGPLDFVLTDAAATYAEKFGYPLGQCIALPKLTVDVFPLDTGEGGGERELGVESTSSVQRPLTAILSRGEREDEADIVFVSNASGTADAMIAQAVVTYGQSAESRELVTWCCGRMVETYATGRSLPTYGDVCAILQGTANDLSLNLPTEDFDRFARWLTHPFNDALYRQQALRWAADAARELGLSLALYGNGWDNHPKFSAFARGPVAYGEPLRRLTRRSRINLQIVPYLCLHQRLLDGLMSGGFFLIRTHPADVAPSALLDFLNANTRSLARTTADAAALLPSSLRGRFDALLAACRPCLCTTGREDVVAMVRDWEEAGQLIPGEGPLPLLDHTGFDDAFMLRDRIARFIDAPSLRDAVSTTQRRSVAERLTYEAGIGRVVRRMSQLLPGAQVAGREVASREVARGHEPGARAA